MPREFLGRLMTTPKKPGRKTREQTEARIMREATDMFAQHGYAATSIRMIADRSGITIPTIYLYYEDKRALYLACCLAVFKRGTVIIQRELIAPLPPEQRIYNYLVSLSRLLIEDPHLAKLFQRELLDADEEGLDILNREAFRESLVSLGEAIEEASDGPVPPLSALSTFALTFGFVQYMQVGDVLGPDIGATSAERGEQLARHVLRITLPQIERKLALAG